MTICSAKDAHVPVLRSRCQQGPGGGERHRTDAAVGSTTALDSQNANASANAEDPALSFSASNGQAHSIWRVRDSANRKAEWTQVEFHSAGH
eukprot:Skav230225  [mRNA]  locus=scaffold1558:109857:110776:- [translate_table: standard]